ncbi:DUF4198 domain-containing protein [Henriciella sp.]|uniref:DUF4198 domain-containing protein n=1 Tax=Henriciella sp. TaxID=1968823 RepID=UPI0026154CD0|nr:DUF4198 domain-containing protein [Henriciella sp.]
MRLKTCLAALALFTPLALAPALPAAAHAGFLMPVSDDTDTSGEIILMASFSDRFPVEEIALKTDSWTIITPDGEELAFDRIAETRTRSILQATLQAEGTYRVSTGERLGRSGKVAKVGNAYIRLDADGLAGAGLADDTEVLTSQTATVSDLYLTRGAPSDEVLDTRIGRLALVPGANPSTLAAGDRLAVTVLFDGTPLAEAPASLFTPSNSGQEDAADTSLMTDTSGALTLDLTEPGPHLLMIRHIAPSPEGAATDVRSYTTVLTLMVE